MGGAVKDQLCSAVKDTGRQGPAVILVNPQLGENIGACARAMLNFGLTDMRLVAPRDCWPNPSAQATAAGALDLIKNAKVFDTTAEAVGNLTYLLAATARRRGLEIPVIGSDRAGPDLRSRQAGGERTGILFGAEKAGLKNEDVVLCDSILTYPVNPAFHSLNLAQAVMVFAYIWGSSESAALPGTFAVVKSEPATRTDIIRLFEHLENELDTAGFFFPPEKKALMCQNIRAPLTRAKMTAQEVQTFRGIIKALARGRGQKGVDVAKTEPGKG
ncbi:MAG: RNA methyltransferase [Hyphomonadaceae bacterium]|nr:RNA methyltransferase [Hyphomonadaceae bacterium]MBC6412553.1 RNA methyltransferase [Hyphomonadaceae bacterium]